MTTDALPFDPETLLAIALRNAIAGRNGVPVDALPHDLSELSAIAREDDNVSDLNDARQRKVRQVLAAAERLEQGTYGQSVVSGKPISPARLHVMPWADCTAVEAHRRSDDVDSSIVLDAAS